MRRFATGIVGAITLAGGSTIAADAAINPYEDKGATLEIAEASVLPDAGQVKAELVKERPEVRLSKWNDEASLTVRYDNVKAEGSRAFLTDRMEWKGDGEEVHAYPLAATAQMEDGGFEIEVVLDAPPSFNRFDFVIEGAEELDFYYQPELTPEEIAGGVERAENVVGSYAVYHRAKRDHIEGETNYATGKAFHIFRPKAIDADGNETWADLSYIEGVLTVVVPEKWLQTATYPVRVDPTFGYTTQGASSNGNLNGNVVGTLHTAPEAGTVVSAAAYMSASLSRNYKAVIVLESSQAIITNGVSPSTAVSTSAAWVTSTYSSQPTITAVGYRIGAIGSGSTMSFFFDTTGVANQGYQYATTFASPANPPGSPTLNTNLWSIYLTYTASGGTTAPDDGAVFFE